MEKKVYLFYLGSYSHLVIADAIIKKKNLPINSILFVTYRGVKLPPCYKDNLLFDESTIDNRKRFFFQNFFHLRRKIKGMNVSAYFPFQQEFPVLKLFNEYIFFEEGLSAYDCAINLKFQRQQYLKSLIKQFVISLLLGKNMLGLYNGCLNGSPFPIDFTLIGLTKNSYHNFQIVNSQREIVQFTGKPIVKSSINNSVIIVMDSTHASDRMVSVDNYLQILSNVLLNFDFKSRKVFLKLHPDNYKDIDVSVNLIKQYLYFVNFELIDESLEDIALSNQYNTFIGTHSTILFYAPIYGNTNESISFVRINAEKDEKYANWIKRWGGIEGTVRLLEQNVKCI